MAALFNICAVIITVVCVHLIVSVEGSEHIVGLHDKPACAWSREGPVTVLARAVQTSRLFVAGQLVPIQLCFHSYRYQIDASKRRRMQTVDAVKGKVDRLKAGPFCILFIECIWDVPDDVSITQRQIDQQVNRAKRGGLVESFEDACRWSVLPHFIAVKHI